MDVPFASIALAVGTAALGSLFASADAAITTLPEGRLQALGDSHPDVFQRFFQGRARVLSRWLVARVISIATAAVLFYDAAAGLGCLRWSGAVGVTFAVITYASFAEVVGTLARRRPERIAVLALRLLRPVEYLVFIFAEPFALLGRLVERRFPEDRPTDARITATEVEWVVAEGEKTGALAEEPAAMIRNVLDFKDLTAKDVMVPRPRVSVIAADLQLPEVLALVAKDGHSRYPVYRDTIDNVVGLLYAKDLFEVVRKQRLDDTTFDSLLRKPILFVAEAQSALSVLREMRARRLHMAVVSDGFGGTSGVVTLEDIIEEIVGEIHDEYDVEADHPVQSLGDGRFLADAAVPIGDLEKVLGASLPMSNAESLGGLIVQHEGRVPEAGTELVLEGMKLVIREADEKRVVKVEILSMPEDKAAPPP